MVLVVVVPICSEYYTRFVSFLFFFLFSSHLLFSFFALSLLYAPSINRRNSDPGSHSRLFSPLRTTRFVPCIFISRRFQPPFSAVDSLKFCVVVYRYDMSTTSTSEVCCFCSVFVVVVAVFGVWCVCVFFVLCFFFVPDFCVVLCVV